MKLRGKHDKPEKVRRKRCYVVACPAAIDVWPSYTVVRSASRRSAIALCRTTLAGEGLVLGTFNFVAAAAPKFDGAHAIVAGRCYEFEYALRITAAQEATCRSLGLGSENEAVAHKKGIK